MEGRPLPETQLITIEGTGFTPDSRLEFFDGVTTYYNRVPTYVNNNTLRYNIRVGNKAANWTVRVLNGAKKSDPFSFTVTAQDTDGAPAAPANPTVSYFADNVYSVAWDAPVDSSGISGIWYKIGSAPSSATDGDMLNVDVAIPLWVVSPSSMPQTIYMWLQDGAGNVDQSHVATAVLQHDPLDPHIDITSPTSLTSYVTDQSAIFLSGISSDLGGTITSITWRNDRGGKGSSSTMASWSSGPIGLFPGSNILTIEATDNLGHVGSDSLNISYTPPVVTNTWMGVASNSWNDPANWSSGTVPGGNDVVGIYSGSVTLSDGFVSSSVLVYGGALMWTGGTIGGGSGTVSIAPAAHLYISGTDPHVLGAGATVNNAGTVIQSADAALSWGGYEYTVSWNGNHFAYPAVFNNLSGALYDAQGDGGMAPGSIPQGGPLNTFNNAGTFRKSGGSGAMTFNSVPFNNTGTVEAQSGTLAYNGPFNNDGTAHAWTGTTFSLTSGGNSSGSFQADDGSSIDLAGGTFNFLPNSTFTGAGSYRVPGTATVNGTIDATNFNVDSLSSILLGNLTITGTMNFTAGQWQNATVTIAAGALLNITGTDLHVIGANVTVNNAGTVIQSADAALSWGGYEYTVSWNGNHFAYPAVFNNLSGALYDAQGDGGMAPGSIPQGGPLNTFNNAGTFRKSGGSGAMTFNSVPFNNTGTVEAQSGTLNYNGAYNQTAGSIDIDGGIVAGPLATLGGEFIADSDPTGLSVTLRSPSTASFNSTSHLSSLTLDAASAVLATGGNRLVTSSLSIINNGVVDLTDGSLILHSSAANKIGDTGRIAILIYGGLNPGGQRWSGNGINSSTAAGDSVHALGVLLNDSSFLHGGAGGAAIYTTFAGEPVTNNDILVRYTHFGDANLDGVVNILDFNILASNFGKTGMTFGQGNFDYDVNGTVNILDFNLLAANFGKQVTAPITEAKTAAITGTQAVVGTVGATGDVFFAAPVSVSLVDLLTEASLL